MKPFIPNLFIFILISICIESCKYDNAVELYPCDSVNVSYKEDVEPIIRNNCYSCHSTQNAPVFGTNQAIQRTIYLEGIDSLKKMTDQGSVIPNIKHEPGFLAMPKGAPKLNQCDIAKIEKWVKDGAPNN